VIQRILSETRTIAVLGGSDRLGRPAHDVPVYLAEHGYQVVHIANGELEHLTEIAAKPELVLVASRTVDLGVAVESAIALGARTVWMQDGIVDEGAARRAEEAGLVAVMDACLRDAHVRWSAGSTVGS
jgi:hypothetical protein